MSRAAMAWRSGRPITALLSLGLLSGCAGLGGNIKGSFACAAPDGICAPSAVIDDRALAMITADPSADAMPAGPYLEQRGKPSSAHSAAVQSPGTLVTAGATRTGERVMRVVFPAYIDERGRLHEASAVHAVVAQGEWQSARASSEPAPTRNALAAAPNMPNLSEAVDRADTPLAVDPTLLTPAAVEAARARKADPVGAIKSDVARRLAASRRDGTMPPSVPTAGAEVPGSPPPVPPAARGSAPPAKPVQPTVRAAAFPAAVAEEE
ncbi:TraV family lipoprotein [Sphingobium estronivorans]|uniref:TraV family lipoprotein n=1 Tax=Sphingobium estronivorans TaxID=1577690 RepID=UPI001F075ADB|nr:TraV family lipoprotein [Sphingobium estronivorans]